MNKTDVRNDEAAQAITGDPVAAAQAAMSGALPPSAADHELLVPKKHAVKHKKDDEDDQSVAASQSDDTSADTGAVAGNDIDNSPFAGLAQSDEPLIFADAGAAEGTATDAGAGAAGAEGAGGAAAGGAAAGGAAAGAAAGGVGAGVYIAGGVLVAAAAGGGGGGGGDGGGGDAVPTVAITDDTTGTATGDVTYTFTFSEAVNGFTADDVTVANGTKGTFTGNDGDTVYTLVVTPTDDTTGNITVDVAAGVATDSANQDNTAATQSVQAFDTAVPPTVVISDDTTGTAYGPVTYTFTFSEAVTGFTADDVTVTNGTKGTFTGSDGDTVYTLVVTPTDDTTGNVTVDVAAAAATDANGNASTAATQSVQAFDTTVTSVTITDDTTGTATGDVTYTFTFSDPVNGFTASDVTVTNGTKGTFTGSDGDTVYTLVVAPTAGAEGDITVDVSADAAVNASSGFGNTAAIQSVQPFDTLAPTATLTTATINASANATVESSEPGTAYLVTTGEMVIDLSDITSLSDGQYNAMAISTPDVPVSLAATGLAEGNYHLYTTDAAGNLSAASSGIVTIDNTAPTVVITDNSTGTATGDVTYTFTFSEAVSGFTAGDITITNGTAGTFTPVSSTVYTLVVTPDAGEEGNITVDVNAGVATDTAGNNNTAATQSVQAFDTIAPTVAITDNTTGTATNDVTYTFTFSEAVSNFTAGDVTITNGTAGTFTAVSSTVYTLVVTPDNYESGNILVDVNAGVATDTAGNNNTAATQSVQAFDTSTVGYVTEDVASFGDTIYIGPGVSAGVTYSLVDPDDGINGLDSGTWGSVFAIDSATGDVSIRFNPDYETPWDNGADNTYNFTVRTDDGVNPPTDQNFTLTVRDDPSSPASLNAPLDLGTENNGNVDMGQLIRTITYNGHTYGFWDPDSSNAIEGPDSTNLGRAVELDPYFIESLAGADNPTPLNGTDGTYNYLTLTSGHRLHLPTEAELTDLFNNYLSNNPAMGWADYAYWSSTPGTTPGTDWQVFDTRADGSYSDAGTTGNFVILEYIV